MQNPLIEKLHIRSADAMVLSNKHRDKCETYKEIHSFCAKSYQEGKSIAYSDAATWALAELRRLKLEFQNGGLTIDSFSQVS